MISTNTLSTFILDHNQNIFCNKNLRSIQYLMPTSKPANQKFKCVCEDFHNLYIINKIAIPGEVQLTFANASVENKSLGESVTEFELAVSLDSLTVISINSDTAFAKSDYKIRLPITEVINRAADGDLARYKNQRDWLPLNAILLPPFLTDAEILIGETSSEDLLKIFTSGILDRAAEEEEDDRDEDEEESKEEKKEENKKKKKATTKTLVTIAYNCDNVLAFIQAVTVKSPRVITTLLYICAEKRARIWFCR